MNEYHITFDEQYVVDSLDCYRRQRHVYPWFIAVKFLCGLGLAALLGIIVFGVITTTGNSAPLIVIGAVLCAFLFFLAMGPRLDYFFLKRRLKKSPFYGDQIRIEISDDGVVVKTERSVSALQWSAFTKAKRTNSGFLVFTEPTQFHWWPDAFLVAGEPRHVDKLLKRKVALYQG
jgi:hypothetical protein